MTPPDMARILLSVMKAVQAADDESWAPYEDLVVLELMRTAIQDLDRETRGQWIDLMPEQAAPKPPAEPVDKEEEPDGEADEED
jgi:hypothetical protein